PACAPSPACGGGLGGGTRATHAPSHRSSLDPLNDFRHCLGILPRCTSPTASPPSPCWHCSPAARRMRSPSARSRSSGSTRKWRRTCACRCRWSTRPGRTSRAGAWATKCAPARPRRARRWSRAAPTPRRSTSSATATTAAGRVRDSGIAIIGEGQRDRYLQDDLDAFIPSPGAIFNHADYEASKIRISRRLTERGYFDADFSSRRVEVTRAEHAADIELVWTSGPRYDMGPTTIEQERPIIRQDLLEKLVYWEEGQYYHQGRLDRLRTSLSRLDYFGDIEITPYPDQAVDNRVPVTVKLTPAKRSI